MIVTKYTISESQIDKDAHDVPYKVAMRLLRKYEQEEVLEEIDEILAVCDSLPEKVRITIGRGNWPSNDHIDIIFWIDGFDARAEELVVEARYEWQKDDNGIYTLSKSYRIEKGTRYRDYDCFMYTLETY